MQTRLGQMKLCVFLHLRFASSLNKDSRISGALLYAEFKVGGFDQYSSTTRSGDEADRKLNFRTKQHEIHAAVPTTKNVIIHVRT